MRSLFIFCSFLFSFFPTTLINSQATITPDVVPGLVLWLRADSGVTLNGGAVSQWADLSGNGYHAVQSSASLRPTVVTVPDLCNHSAIRFDGSDDVLNGVTIPGMGDSSATILVLVKGNNASNANAKRIFGFGDVGTGMWLYQGGTPQSFIFRNNGVNVMGGSLPQSGFSPTLLEVVKSLGSTVRLFVNGTQTISSNNSTIRGPFTNDAYSLGFGTYYFSGDISEILVYNQVLTDSMRGLVEKYLYNRQIASVQLGADTILHGFCPYTLHPVGCATYNSYMWSNGETLSSTTVTKSGRYSLSATDIFGRTTADTIQVSYPNSAINISDTAICLGASINVGTQLQLPADYTYLWNTSDTTENINVSDQGSYWVTITDTTAGHCIAISDTVLLTIDSLAATVSLGPDISLCSGELLSLLSPSTGLVDLNFNWSTGNTDSTITVFTTGQYAVTVTDSMACWGSDSINITISATAPVVNFTSDTLCLGEAYQPINNSYSLDTATPIVSYLWQFGNNDSSLAVSPHYIYGVSGVYAVTLSAVNTVGCTGKFTQNIEVRDVPVAMFDTGIACIFNPYYFTDLSLPPSGNTITNWAWSFGDANNSTAQNPSHLYSTASTYPVTLVVTAANTCSDTMVNNLTVVNSASLPNIPELLQPANHISVSSHDVNFSWNSSLNASRYSLIVSTDIQFVSSTVYSNINSTQQTITLGGNQHYYWKVKAYNLCNDSVESLISDFSVFSPIDLPNLLLWLRADTGNNSANIGYWNDISGNSNNSTQAVTSNQPGFAPSTNLINHKPTIVFDGTNDFIQGNTISNVAQSSLSVFVVAKGNNASIVSAKKIFGIGDISTGMWLYQGGTPQSYLFRNNGQYIFGGALPQTGFPFTLFSAQKDFGNSVSLFQNGLQTGTSNNSSIIGAFTNGTYSIGDGTSYFSGEIAEVILFNSYLDSNKRQQVENYLFNRYAPPVNLGPDIHQPYSLCPITLDASDRFVSYVWSTGETTPQIQARKSGTFWVQTTDVFNRVSADTIQVFIPYLGVSPRDTVVCLYSPLSIAPVLTSSPYTFEWNTLETSPSISVTSSGDYVCTISDTSACAFISDTIHVVIDSFALQSLLPADTTLCAGNPIMLDTAGHSITGISWSNGPTTPAVSFNTTGDYIATATDNHLCVNRDTIQINISWIAPNTNFTSTVVCFGDTTQLSDVSAPASPDNITTWNWDFGDGNSSSLPSPSHYYNSPGDYNVTLSIVTDSGCTGIKTKVVTSSVPPIPAFTYPNIICAGVPTTLLDNSIFLFGDSITNWIWTFNGTDTLSAKNPIYEFPGVGSYQVKLKAVSKSGCSDTITQKIDVFPSLVANFNAANVCIGDSTIFTDATSSYSVVSWQWDFGDLTFFSTKQNPKHKYSVPGSYNVSLRIENAIGCVDYESKNINIVTKPTATFGDLVTCVSDYYTPLDSSVVNNDTIATWNWTIAGANYTNQTPVHFFADTGLYAVHLKVTTLNGCTDSITKMVKVKPHPTALFSFAPLYGEAPVDIAFINQSRGASSYLWNFGDSETSTDEMPLHTYTQNGSYQIHLAAYSTEGCEDTASKIFVVKPTDLDLAVTEVSVIQAQQTDGSYLIGAKAKIANLGTRTITQAKFYITIGSGGIISEEWNGLLYSGQIMDTIFGAQFVVAPENANSYICVEAVSVNHGETEIRMDNNSQCSAISQHIQLIGPSPNPVAGASYLGLILPKSGSVIIDIADLAGQYVVKGLSLNLPKGRSDYSLPVDKMRAAEYFIRVYYNDEKLTRKFVVGK